MDLLLVAVKSRFECKIPADAPLNKVKSIVVLSRLSELQKRTFNHCAAAAA